MSKIRIAFDAYGTLFDVYSVGALAEQIFPGHGARLAEIWRVAQIDYTRILTLCGRYRDFRALTEDGLNFACKSLGLHLTEAGRDALMSQYDRLSAFPENLEVLRSLKSEGASLAILSNGTPGMLESAVTAAGMEGLFDHLLSVETVGKFKTAPEAYQMGPDAFGCPAQDIIFVSSNGWDVCGATWFGYRTFWINRTGKVLEELGVVPTGEGKSLSDLLTFVRNEG